MRAMPSGTAGPVRQHWPARGSGGAEPRAGSGRRAPGRGRPRALNTEPYGILSCGERLAQGLSKKPQLQRRSTRLVGSAVMAHSMYDELAAAYAADNEANAFNALYERPAMLSLIGDVRGQRVLDAGCGAGALAEAL